MNGRKRESLRSIFDVILTAVAATVVNVVIGERFFVNERSAIASRLVIAATCRSTPIRATTGAGDLTFLRANEQPPLVNEPYELIQSVKNELIRLRLRQHCNFRDSVHCPKCQRSGRLKPGPHQQQCRSNIVECYNVERCFDIVASVDRT